MIRSTSTVTMISVALVALLVTLPACNRSSDGPEEANVLPATPDIDAAIAAENTGRDLRRDEVGNPNKSTVNNDRGADVDGNGDGNVDGLDPPDVPVNQPTIAAEALPSVNVPETNRETRRLSQSLSPAELQAFLADVDKDLEQAIRNAGNQPGKEDLQNAKNIAQLKLQAARQLANHAGADQSERVLGRRGELQGLSHLAQLRDVNAATQLEVLASKYSDDEAEDLRMDARLVMIGFAIERLQNGVDDAETTLLKMNEELVDTVASDNVMAMMAMGQSRDWLARLDHNQEANRVRDLIREKFGRSKDPQIAQMAAGYAGEVQFDEINSLVDAIATGQKVNESRWRDAVNELIDVASDVRTVQFLCGTTLECEASGQPDLALVTYEILQDRIASQDNAMGREARTAIELHEARQARIGQPLNETLVPINSDTPSVDSLRGKVVLVPFWSGYVSESLLLIPLLQQLEDQNPNRVAVVGVNVDPVDPDLATKMKAAGFNFASYQTKFDPAQKVSPIAAKYGLGGHPMTVVLDQQGNVAAITFGDKQIPNIVNELLR